MYLVVSSKIDWKALNVYDLNHHVKNNVVRNFDKFELEEKLLLVCLYNFELGSKTTPSLFIYIYTLSWGQNDFELGAKWLGGETTAIPN